MKKIFTIVLGLCLALSLSSCGDSSARSVVTRYCDAVKKFDAQGMAKCVGEEVDQIDVDNLNGDYIKEIFDKVKSNAKKIKYSVVDEKESDGVNYITVKFEYVDLSLAFGHAIQNIFQNAFALAFSGNTDEGSIENMFSNSFNDYISENKEDIKEITVEFECKKSESKWLISDVDINAISDIATGGIMSAASKLADAFAE